MKNHNIKLINRKFKFKSNHLKRLKLFDIKKVNIIREVMCVCECG